ncbi:MAG: thioredoxin family protein [bacterium]|nr:thioredoxin family protein [bacterium]
MSKKYGILRFVLLCAATLGICISSCIASPSMDGMTSAPTFTLSDTNGKSVSFADYVGKMVVLEWTNPDCPFVKRHYKSGTMKRLAEKFAAQGVVWLAVSSTHFHDTDKLSTWANAQALPYPVLVDQDGKVGKQFGALTTPHMFVINKDGKIAYSGAIDNDSGGDLETPVNYVEQALTSLIASKPVETTQTKSYGCSVKYS